MDRIIKFRVWDRQLKKYTPFNPIWCGFESKEYDYEQFTGVTDKNNKEIYEGDIVLCANKLKYEIKHGFFKHCDYLNSLYGWYLFGLQDNGWTWPLYDDIEIIGNVFENPELLK